MIFRATAVACLIAGAAACDVRSLQAQTSAMDDKCCTNNNCVGGVPKKCSKTCAPAFNTLWKDCGAYLAFLPGGDIMKQFAETCATSKPAGKDDKKESCDAGSLLTTMFFTCSGIDQNVAKEFCHTECHKGVESYVKRCQKTETASTKQVFNQAKKWLSNCAGPTNECHSTNCHGKDEDECQKSSTHEACVAQNAAANNIFCRWQHCAGREPSPPPPHKVITGCTDSKALNYNPKATVMADGSCLYKAKPVPPPPPGSTSQCSKQRYYQCHTQAACEGAKMQWIPCTETIKYGGKCYGTQQKQGGQCARPCVKGQTYNCHNPTKCAAADGQWYQAPPYRAGAKPPAARCENKCSSKSTNTCRTQAQCNAAKTDKVKLQWLEGVKYTDASGKVTRQNPGRCTYACDAKRYSSCRSEQSCSAIGHSWSPGYCCGNRCPQYPPGQDYGSCQRPCTANSPYTCNDEIACEGVGRQWIASPPPPPSPPGSKCTGEARTGSCQVPCTEDHYYDCKSKASCEAVGLEWRAPVVHTYKTGACPHCNPPRPAGTRSYTQAARCDYSCTLANPNSCDTQQECEGIGYQWQLVHYTKPPTDPSARKGYCRQPCTDANPNGCLNQKDCLAATNAWILEPVHGGRYPGICPGPGCHDVIIDPGFGGGGRRDAVGRRLQSKPPPPPVAMKGRCIESCKLQDIYACRSEDTCTKVGGTWQKRGGKPQPGVPTGFCRQGCSVDQSYMCKTSTACSKVGGTWSRNRCDTRNAPCDVNMFLSVCGASGKAGVGGGVKLCDDQCGRYIMRSYDRCSKKPPAGMTAASWKEHFGPIVSMCKSFRKDPSMSRCTRQTQEATDTMTKVCCTKDTDCKANNGVPTKCDGRCADVFLPFFEQCGAILLNDDGGKSQLGRFYKTCTATGKGNLGSHDPKLCHANSGNSPFIAIEFRDHCGLWIKYTDAKTKETSDFVRLVGIGTEDAIITTETLIDSAKTYCGKTDMVKVLAEEFSGVLALSQYDEKGSTLPLVVNEPTLGNVDITATNTPGNTNLVHKQWKTHYKPSSNSNTGFNPDRCGTR